MKNKEVIECRCGCGKLRPRYDKKGIERFYILGHQFSGKETSMEAKAKQSRSKKKLYKEKGNVIGFKKKNRLWDNPNAIKTQFKEGQTPWNLNGEAPWAKNLPQAFKKGQKPWNKNKSMYSNPKEIQRMRTVGRRYKLTLEQCQKLIENGCMVCGWNLTVDIHHKDKNKENNSKDNLLCLCPNCHSLVHRLKININELLKYE